MMRHIVMFRRRPGVEKQVELEASLIARMQQLDRQIDFVRDWRVSANELDRPICWDYVLESTFDDAQAVNRYLPHPAHQALVADLKPYFEWVAVDYSF
ncbi:Dabb family protein [Massilia timonae]|uniref:Dabb family protein n=1 Tax=Massilia timonae TaxID=47229 RepID=UPI0028D29E59|nr:Dabb family protein [Massilia timonae]